LKHRKELNPHLRVIVVDKVSFSLVHTFFIRDCMTVCTVISGIARFEICFRDYVKWLTYVSFPTKQIQLLI